MMNSRFIKVASLSIILAWSTTASALSCSLTSYENQLEFASNVFLARVESSKIFPEIDYVKEQANLLNYERRKDRKIAVTLKIIEVFKGDSIASEYEIRPGWQQTRAPWQVGES